MAKQYGMLIDLKRCIGCQACTLACKVENDTALGVEWHRVLTVGGEHTDSPRGTYPNLSMYWLPMPCMHCQEPPCAEACPTEAITRRDDGIVLIDQDKCVGCGYCRWACPYDGAQYNAEEGVVEKCTFCAHRVDWGLEPFCVEACVWGARIFGDLNDPNSDVSRAIARKRGEVLLSEQETHPAVFYSAP